MREVADDGASVELPLAEADAGALVVVEAALDEETALLAATVAELEAELLLA